MEHNERGQEIMRWLQKRFALSERGTIELVIACMACAFQNFALMLPVGLVYSFTMYIYVVSVSGMNAEKSAFYLVGCIVLALLMFLASFFQYNATFLATYRESGVRRVNLAERLRKIPLSFFAHKDLADLTSSIMNDCAALETSQSHFLAPLIGSGIFIAFMAVSLLAIEWRMAIAALWVLPVAFGIVIFSSRVQQGFSRLSLSARVECEEGVQEFLECSKDLRSNNCMNEYLDGLTQKVSNMEKRAMSSELGTAVFVVSAYLVLKLGLVSVALAGSVLYSSGNLSMPTFILFLMTASRLYDPLEVSLQNLAAIIATRSGIERMNEIYEQPLQTGAEKLTNRGYDIEFHDVSFSYGNGQPSQPGTEKLTDTGHDTEFHDVSFSYGNGQPSQPGTEKLTDTGHDTEFHDVSFSYDGNNDVLHNISFTARQGEVTALVGHSGSGKSTTAGLIMRLWDIQRGKITIGGMNISDVDPEILMSLISVVFQDVILFNNSVLENIRIGRRNATNEEVINAGKLANCGEFISRLPNGWHTVIGENGCELSGGERQRISIARAFLKNAPIVLLDEATASLDVENESVIQSAISRLIKNKTVIVIAHRMRTIMGADKVIVLSDGRIQEQGSPEELLRQDGIFAHMAALQGVNRE